MEISDLSQTASYWDEHGIHIDENRAHWLAHPSIEAHYTKTRDGLSLADWFIKKYLNNKPIQRAISIGTGVASFELALLQAGMIEHYDLYDLSQVSLKQAEEQARQLGIEKRVQFFLKDINQTTLPDEHYDLVTFIHSLHHVTDLEPVLQQVYRAMKPNSVFFSREYIGPNRFAFPPEDTEFARQLYTLLNPELKSPWPELPLPNPQDVIAADPTEAVHSAEIVAAVQKVFGNIEITSLNSALCFIIWPGLKHDALYDTTEGRSLVESLIEIDTALVKNGDLPSYFAEIAAFKKTKTPTKQLNWQEVKNLLFKIRARIRLP